MAVLVGHVLKITLSAKNIILVFALKVILSC